MESVPAVAAVDSAVSAPLGLPGTDPAGPSGDVALTPLGAAASRP